MTRLDRGSSSSQCGDACRRRKMHEETTAISAELDRYLAYFGFLDSTIHGEIWAANGQTSDEGHVVARASGNCGKFRSRASRNETDQGRPGSTWRGGYELESFICYLGHKIDEIYAGHKTRRSEGRVCEACEPRPLDF